MNLTYNWLFHFSVIHLPFQIFYISFNSLSPHVYTTVGAPYENNITVQVPDICSFYEFTNLSREISLFFSICGSSRRPELCRNTNTVAGFVIVLVAAAATTLNVKAA